VSRQLGDPAIARWVGVATLEAGASGEAARRPGNPSGEGANDGHSGALVRWSAQWACIERSEAAE
jgi:hypothetical protein